MKEHEAENVEEDEGSGKDLRSRKAKLVLLVIKTCSGTTNMFLDCSQSPIFCAIVEIMLRFLHTISTITMV